jgi:ABC-type multidrug transport system fused ATPase/permease subunit
MDSHAAVSHQKSEDPLFDMSSAQQDCDSSGSTIASEHAPDHRSPTGLINEEEIVTLNRIATQTSQRRSSVYSHHAPKRTATLATISENDPAVDPQGPSFDLNKWLKMVLRESQKQGREGHRTGIVFKNLTVSGTGAALQLQDTVSSMLSAPLRIGEMLQQRRSSAKRILNEFNGLLKSGELLLVLGRPGSGCSTFLKSLCGELHGLSLDSQSVIHYDGIV